MNRIMAALALLSVSAGVSAQSPGENGPAFEWPQALEAPMRDLRVADDVEAGREAEREAKTRAAEGRRAAAHAMRRAGVQGALGLNPQAAIVDDDTVIQPTQGHVHGGTLGTITYSTGAVMTGLFGADVGVYVAGPESTLERFEGWVSGAVCSQPMPRDGFYQWRNGSSFLGTIIGDGSDSRGVFTDADGERRFVGVVDLSGADFRPVSGQLETSSGRLLAVVLTNR